MNRKLMVVTVAVVVLIAGGWYAHSKLGRQPSERPPVASNWPTAPAEPPAASKPSTGHPPVERSKEAVAPEAIFSLRPGETLLYDANIAKLNSTVARLKIVAVEKRNVGGRPSWHLRAFANTENPYRMVFELDDQFDSYSDAETMVSRQYEMHLSERGQKADSVQKMMPSVQNAPPAGMSAALVLPGTRDPLGMLNYLRGIDWNTTNEVHSPVYDGHKMYDVRAKQVSRAQPVTVPAGSYKAMKIELRVFENGAEMKDAHFLLYLTNDQRRLPVLLEAVLPFATARVELSQVP